MAGTSSTTMARTSGLWCKGGSISRLSNLEVLRAWRVAPCDLELAARLLKWLQAILMDTGGS